MRKRKESREKILFYLYEFPFFTIFHDRLLFSLIKFGIRITRQTREQIRFNAKKKRSISNLPSLLSCPQGALFQPF